MIKLEDILKSIPNQEIIECEDGQWQYPGRITRIPSNRITMKPNPENWRIYSTYIINNRRSIRTKTNRNSRRI